MVVDYGKKMDDFLFDFLNALPDIPKEKWGVEFEAQCPCGGKIKASRSTYNGHLFATCDLCKFTLRE